MLTDRTEEYPATRNVIRANRFEAHLSRLVELWFRRSRAYDPKEDAEIYADLSLSRLGESLDVEFEAAEKSLRELGVAWNTKKGENNGTR